MLVACSNDYLGLGALPGQARSGSCSSRLISGTLAAHTALEEELEDWLGRPALLFPSGYHANVGVFSTVCGPGQKVASDALNHASIIDGLRLSRADRTIVPHGSPEAVPDDADLLVLESLYSMDGDIPDLRAYPTRPWLAVDEAHAIGAMGPEGRGLAAQQGVEPDILIGPLGKAFGATGAFVAGPPELKDLLINTARSFIYTTSPGPIVVDTLRRNLARIRQADEERARLATNALRLRTHLRQLGWTVLGDAHILPVLTGAETMDLADRLLERGVLAVGIRHPTVPVGQERIRVTVSAAHTPEQLDRIATAFGPRTG